MTIDKLERLFRNQYQSHHYTRQSVDRHMIKRILAAGIQAPGPLPKKPWKFKVVDGPIKIRRISDELDETIRRIRARYKPGSKRDSLDKHHQSMKYLRDVPLLVFCYTTTPGHFENEFHEDCESRERASGLLLTAGMVLQNMMLTATALELGSSYTTAPLIAEKALDKILKTPKGYRLIAVMTFGHPSDKNRNPDHVELKDFIFR
jgi:nitroreductase